LEGTRIALCQTGGVRHQPVLAKTLKDSAGARLLDTTQVSVERSPYRYFRNPSGKFQVYRKTSESLPLYFAPCEGLAERVVNPAVTGMIVIQGAHSRN
jgi:hypothetical protein